MSVSSPNLIGPSCASCVRLVHRGNMASTTDIPGQFEVVLPEVPVDAAVEAVDLVPLPEVLWGRGPQPVREVTHR
eukprot:1177495-Prorocentrum_minimum.AAC.2